MKKSVTTDSENRCTHVHTQLWFIHMRRQRHSVDPFVRKLIFRSRHRRLTVKPYTTRTTASLLHTRTKDLKIGAICVYEYYTVVEGQFFRGINKHAQQWTHSGLQTILFIFKKRKQQHVSLIKQTINNLYARTTCTYFYV